MEELSINNGRFPKVLGVELLNPLDAQRILYIDYILPGGVLSVAIYDAERSTIKYAHLLVKSYDRRRPSGHDTSVVAAYAARIPPSMASAFVENVTAGFSGIRIELTDHLNVGGKEIDRYTPVFDEMSGPRGPVPAAPMPDEQITAIVISPSA